MRGEIGVFRRHISKKSLFRLYWRKKCVVKLVKVAKTFPQMRMVFNFASHVGGHAWRNIDTTRFANIHALMADIGQILHETFHNDFCRLHAVIMIQLYREISTISRILKRPKFCTSVGLIFQNRSWIGDPRTVELLQFFDIFPLFFDNFLTVGHRH